MLDLSRKTHVVIHHSLTKDSGTVSWGAIRDYHVNVQGWRDIGYHYGIELVNDKVEVLLGRMLHEVAAAVKESTMNTRGVHVCIVGNFDIAAPIKPVWTKAVDLTAFLCELLDIPTSNVMPHTHYAPYKSCPGTKFDMPRFRNEVSTRRRSV